MENAEELFATAVAKFGIGGYRRHVLLCVGGNCADAETGAAAWQALKQELKQSGLTEMGAAECYRSKVDCLRVCMQGPIMVVYPEGHWYRGMTADRIPRFVREHLIEGRPISEWVFADNPLSADGHATGGHDETS